MISILIPIYNGIEFIEQSINSVKSQTFSEYEVIIGINGHDRDSAVEKRAREFESDKLKVIYYETKGKASTMNEMLKDCQYEWISILDVDYIWLPTKLEDQLQYMNKYDVIGTQCEYFGDSHGNPAIPLGDISNFDFIKSNPVINSSALVKKKLCHWEGNKYNDYDMWLRIWKNGFTFFNVNKVLVLHRIHKASFFNNRDHHVIHEIQNFWKNRQENKTTIVTAYFQIKSKRTHETYLKWMNNLLAKIETNMVIFTDIQSYSLIYNIRKPYLKFTKIIITNFENFKSYKYFEYFKKHYDDLDLEKNIHNPYLYMIWAEKVHFVKHCIDNNYFNSLYYFWCDIGSLRNEAFCPDVKKMTNWPYFTDKNTPKNKIVIAKTGNWTQNDFSLSNQGIIEQDLRRYLHTVGGLFGGDKFALLVWINEYEQLLLAYIQHNKFIGKDQSIYLNIIYRRPDIVNIIKSKHDHLNAKYFAIYDYFSRNA